MSLVAALAVGLTTALGVALAFGVSPKFELKRPRQAGESRLELWLQQAGVSATAAQFVVASVAVGFVAAVLVGLLTGVWVIGVVLGAMLAMVPAAYFGRRRMQRLHELQSAWPDGLRDLRASIASGRSLHQAIVSLSRGGPDPIQEAFSRYESLSQMLDVPAALDVVKSEVADPTTDRIVEVLILASERGGRIVGEIIDDLAKATTADLRALEEVETDSLQHKLNAWAVFALPWLVLTALILRDGPFREFYQTPVGLLVVVAGAAMSAVGVMVVRRLGRRPIEERVLVGSSSKVISAGAPV